MTSISEAYIRLLNLLQAVRGEPEFAELDANELDMLDHLGMRWLSSGGHVTVLDIMNSKSSGVSPSTAHKRLKGLRTKGYIRLEIQDDDNRVKLVVPTTKAEAYFTRMASCLNLTDPI